MLVRDKENLYSYCIILYSRLKKIPHPPPPLLPFSLSFV
jgi:hypothetical protein